MAEVRAQPGVPTVSAFTGLGAPSLCAPIVMNSTTGFLYTLKAGDVVVPAAMGGTVTSVAMTVPTQFSVAGSPVTGSGTLAVTWQTQTANRILSGPATGSAAAPTFRALVNADFPASGVSAATYTYATVAVNAQGIVTSASSGTAPVTNISVTAPITTTGGTTPTIGITLAANVAAFLATPSSANLATAVTDEVGTGSLPFQSQGTWTPTDASGAAITFASATGRYIKTGDMMYAIGSVTYPSPVVDGSNAVIGSLPVNAKNVFGNRGGDITNTDFGAGITIQTLENTANLYLFDLTGAHVTNVQMSGKTVGFTAAYITA